MITKKKINKDAQRLNGNKQTRGSSIQLAYWNKGPSHLVNKHHDIEAIIAAYKPDILGIGEANFKTSHDVNDARQEGYNLHLGPGLDSLGVARVAVYVKEGLVVKRRPDLEGGNVCTLWLQIGRPNRPGTLFMFGYRQWQLPGQVDNTSGTVAAQLERWLVILEQWERALGEGRETICMLDANLDFLTWTNENLPSYHSSVKLRQLTQALFTRILPLGVTQMVTGPTRAEKGVAVTGLDHLYSNKPTKLSEVRTEFTGMSDHKIILVRKFTRDLDRRERYTKKRVFKNFQPDRFQTMVSSMPEIAACLASTSADTAAFILNQGITRILDTMAPVRTIQTKKSYVPYLTTETKELQLEAKKAQIKAALSGEQEDWRLYRSIRNQKNRAVKNDELKWQQAKLSKINNPSDMWKTAKSLLGWVCAGPPTQLYHMGQYITSPAGLATTMNNFFLSKVKKLRDSIPHTDVDPLSKMKESMKNRSCSFSFSSVTSAQIQIILTNLRGSKATGVDFIDVQSLKIVTREISPCIAHITNLSITTNIFPESYKYAKVVPLLKSSDKSPQNCSSYRPVSLLPVISRVVEKALFSQLSEYLESNQLLHPNHHGGRKWHNTTTALIQINDEWLAAAEEGMMTGVMMTDLSAAYDLWDHQLGLKKAHLLGVSESACAWISSYISGRSQSTIVDGYISSPLKLPTYSVPQGSVGAPLLFLMANSDLPDVIHDHKVQFESPTGHCQEDGDSVHFVDDGTVIFSHQDPASISQVLSSHYKKIAEYMAANKLVINDEKTHLMVMAPRRLAGRRDEVLVQAGEFIITPSETEKILGIRIHQSMTWNQHVKDGEGALLKQLTTRVNGLRKLSHRGDKKTKLALANGIVISKLAYGLEMWGNCQGYLRKALQVQQLTAARAVCGYRSYYWSKTKLLSSCKWLSINQMYWQQVLTMAHKIIISKKPVNVHQRMTAQHGHHTRAATGVSRGFGNNLVKSSFNHSATEYNKLPEEIKGARTMQGFKKSIRTWVEKNIQL